MIYDIGLTIAYEYDRPAVAGRHILRLLPADVPGVQRRITGGARRSRPSPPSGGHLVDFFGNAGVEVAFREAHDEILFRVTARVERLAQPPTLDISPGLDAPRRRDRRLPRPRRRRAAPLPRRRARAPRPPRR